MIHLDRAGKRNGLANMLLRVLQQRRDGAAPIICRDWRMSSLADWHPEDALLQIG